MSDTKQKINIEDKELDRDLVNLNLPQEDMVPDSLDEDTSYYDDDMNDWLKEDSEKDSK